MQGLQVIIGQMKERKQFIRGLALGLTYGVVGNIAVSHYYGLFEGLWRGLFDDLFYFNLVMLIGSLSVILLLTRKWYGELKKIDARFENLREMLERHLKGDQSSTRVS